MSKQQIKEKVLEAIENDPHKDDILKVSLFGSQLDETAKGDSDVDLLIEFDPKASVGFFKFFDIKYNLEKHINKEVDLLTPDSLSHFFRDQVLGQAQVLYEKR